MMCVAGKLDGQPLGGFEKRGTAIGSAPLLDLRPPLTRPYTPDARSAPVRPPSAARQLRMYIRLDREHGPRNKLSVGSEQPLRLCQRPLSGKRDSLTSSVSLYRFPHAKLIGRRKKIFPHRTPSSFWDPSAWLLPIPPRGGSSRSRIPIRLASDGRPLHPRWATGSRPSAPPVPQTRI